MRLERGGVMSKWTLGRIIVAVAVAIVIGTSWPANRSGGGSSPPCTTNSCIVTTIQQSLAGGAAVDGAVMKTITCQPSTVKSDGNESWTATFTVGYSDGSTATGYGSLVQSEDKVYFEPGALAPSPSPSAPPSCSAQLATWRSSGDSDAMLAVTDEMNAVRDDLGALEQDQGSQSAAAEGVTSLRSDAGSLQAATRQAGGGLPPSCVPGMRKADAAMLMNASKAATGTLAAIGDVENGHSQAGTTLLTNAVLEISAGTQDYGKAVTEAKAYGGVG
jgi:hypothetical protein